MQNDPQFSESPSDRLFQTLQAKWIALLVFIVVSFIFLMFNVDVSREPELPNRPLTKADLPLLKKKVKFLKSDAANLSKFYHHLHNPAESQAANQAWEELYYTPEIFPAAAELRRVQNARLLELRPDLAGHVQARQDYEEGRYEIANDPAVSDKTAAIDALKSRLGPALKDPEYSRNAKQALAVLESLIGDPELDRAEQAYQQACSQAILKRHPELAAYYQELTYRNEAYHHFMSQANALTRQIAALENGVEPARPTAPKPETPVAGNFNGPTNPPATAPTIAMAVPPTALPPPPLPDAAVQHGVAVGDTVDISALKPAIALRHAKLTAMDNDQLTVRAGEDIFTVRWQDVIHLKKTDAAKAH